VNWKIRGRGVRRKPGEMNKTEERYAQFLTLRQRVGEIEHFDFDAVKLRLADTTFYTPDFMVMLADGTIEFHEVKGFWEDDARVKIKVAAETFPFVFRAMSPIKGGDWKHEEF
jgi:hypothetical protein